MDCYPRRVIFAGKWPRFDGDFKKQGVKIASPLLGKFARAGANEQDMVMGCVKGCSYAVFDEFTGERVINGKSEMAAFRSYSVFSPRN